MKRLSAHATFKRESSLWAAYISQLTFRACPFSPNLVAFAQARLALCNSTKETSVTLLFESRPMVPLTPFFLRAVRKILTVHPQIKWTCWLIIGVVYNFIFYHRPTLCSYCSKIILVRNAFARRTPEGIRVP